MSSKKKRRYQAWLERKKKRDEKRKQAEKLDKAIESGDLKNIADAMGILLK